MAHMPLEPTHWMGVPPAAKNVEAWKAGDFLTLTDEGDGKLFLIRILNTGEMRITRSSLIRRRTRRSQPSLGQVQRACSGLSERSTNAGLTDLRLERRSAGVSPFPFGLLWDRNIADRHPWAD